MPEILQQLELEEIKSSGGPVVSNGCQVTILYRMALSPEQLNQGDCIETTYSPDIPIVVCVDEHSLLSGVYRGILGIQTGGSVRRLGIPSSLAFGERGYGPVPPNSDIYVEICAISLVHTSI